MPYLYWKKVESNIVNNMLKGEIDVSQNWEILKNNILRAAGWDKVIQWNLNSTEHHGSYRKERHTYDTRKAQEEYSIYKLVRN